MKFLKFQTLQTQYPDILKTIEVTLIPCVLNCRFNLKLSMKKYQYLEKRKILDYIVEYKSQNHA